MAMVDISEIQNKTADQILNDGPPAPGKAMLVITGVDDDSDEDRVTIDASIVAHDKPSEVGKDLTIKFHKSGKMLNRSVKLLLATGVLDPADWAAMCRGEKLPEFPFKHTYSRCFCGDIESREYTGRDGEKKKYNNINFKILDPMSPAAKEYPKDMKYLKANESTGRQEATTNPVPF